LTAEKGVVQLHKGFHADIVTQSDLDLDEQGTRWSIAIF